MSLPLTPEHLASCYEFLRTTPPFRKWKLPHADEIVFTVNKHQSFCGSYQQGPGDRHEICMSIACVGHTDTLVRIMGHEMIHLAQVLSSTEPKGDVMHNKDFHHRAKLVCRVHGWDEKLFV